MGTLPESDRKLVTDRLSPQLEKTGSPELLFPDLYYAPFQGFTNSHSAGNVITQVTSVPTFLHGVHVRLRGGAGAGSSFSIFDNLTASSVKIFTVRAGIDIELVTHPLLDVALSAGMRIDIGLPVGSEIDYTLTFKLLR